MINIYDGNNYYRKTLETDNTGYAPRGIYNMTMLSNDINVWCWDGADGNARRRKWYPEYKRNRKPLDKDIYVGFDFLKQILSHTRAVQVEVPGYEADDVIATLARHYAHKDEVCIYSNDYDLLQLSHEFPNRVFVGAKPKASVPATYIREYKCLVGDPADNIPGIKGFGEKAWESLTPEMARRLIQDILSGGDYSEDYKLSTAVWNWLETEGNDKLIIAFWNIVSLIDIPLEELTEHIKPGDGDGDKAEALLKEFML